jgi:signal transduction histidine kinase
MAPDTPLSQRLTQFFDALTGISSGLDLRATLQRILAAAVETVDARYGALAVLDAAGTGMSEFLHVGIPDDVAASLGHTPRGEGVLGYVIRHPEPLRLANLRSHPSSIGFPEGHPVMETFVGVPVVIRGEVFGNLYLTQKRSGGEFTADDERLLVARAAAAAAAIDNARLYESSLQRERWQGALAEVAQAGLESRSVTDVLPIVAAGARALVAAETALIALADDDGDIVVEHIDGDTSLFTVGTGEVVLNAAMRDPDATAITVPMLGRDAHPGIVIVAWRETPPLDQVQNVDMVTTFVEQAGLILQLTQSRQEQERLAIFEERDRIARDLHDLIIQRIFAAGIQLQGALRSDDGANRISDVISSLDETIREIRKTIFSLESDDDGRSVRARILQEIDDSRAGLGFAPRLELHGPLDTMLDNAMADHLVAVVREALSNIVKHAGASDVLVRISVDPDRVELVVVDDGHGIGDITRRSGLANIESRAQQHGGSVVIERESGEGGTRLTWSALLR